MKSKLASLLGVGAVATGSAVAQTVTFNDAVPAGSQLIRDYDFSGMTRSIMVSQLDAALSYDITVSLRIDSTDAGTVLGDYYAYLYHADANGARSVVLLNRVGASTMFPAGYTDEAMDVTLNDGAVNGDIHSYRMTLGGPSQPPLNGPLTGAWQPDGRTESPFTVSYDSPRLQRLADFDGMSANGEWDLFIADVSYGAEGKLADWSVSFTPVQAVPEPPASQICAVLGGLAGLMMMMRRKR